MRRIGRFGKSRGMLKVLLLVVALGLAGPGSGWGYQLPALNLGLTSFLDGGPPAGPGLYLTEYINYYTSGRFTDINNRGLLPVNANEDLHVWAFLTQVIYQSDRDILLGGKWGIDLILPVVHTDLKHDLGGPPEDNGAGFGDVLIGPFLQWDPIMGADGPRFMHRIEFQMIFPTGKYDSDREINPGSNFFSFNPYWAATVFVTPKWTASWRIHYLWNADNEDPNRGFFGADETQAGQAIHLNFATAYMVIENMLRVGINGYYLKQLSDTEVDGNDLADSREQVLGIGPGAVFHLSKDSHIFFNTYFETAAENRTEGMRFNLRFVQHF